MMKMLEGPQIECKKCHSRYEIDINMFEKTDSLYDEEKSMGRETHHIWQYEAKCKICNNNDINVVVEAWEYPEGAIDSESSDESEGCTIIKESKLEAQID